MPAILSEEDQETWLRTPPEELPKALAVLKPYAGDEFILYPVSDESSNTEDDPLDLFGG